MALSLRASDSTRVGLFLAAIFAAGAVLTAYLPLWMADRGFTAAGIGQVLGLASLLRVVAVPAWGWAADRLARERTVLFTAAALAAASAVALAASPGFALATLLIVAGGIAGSALPPLTDALTLALAAARRLDYGRTRAWGSVAFMLATAVSGVLLGRFGAVLVPWLLAGGYGLAAAFTGMLPVSGKIRHAPSPTLPRLPAVFGWTLLATSLIQGSHAAYYAFAPLYWRSAGLSDGLIGLLIAEGIVAEILLFVWGRGLVERLGPRGLTTLAASACVLRWSVLASTAALPVLLVVQLLHAATFACQHLSSMLVLRTLPPGRAGVAQTIMAALGFSAPTGVLIWLSGRVYEDWGAAVFLLMAATGGAGLLVRHHLPRGARRA